MYLPGVNKFLQIRVPHVEKPRVEKISRFEELLEISIFSKARKLWYNPLFHIKKFNLQKWKIKFTLGRPLFALEVNSNSITLRSRVGISPDLSRFPWENFGEIFSPRITWFEKTFLHFQAAVVH
jgi:hypothetical protein